MKNLFSYLLGLFVLTPFAFGSLELRKDNLRASLLVEEQVKYTLCPNDECQAQEVLSSLVDFKK